MPRTSTKRSGVTPGSRSSMTQRSTYGEKRRFSARSSTCSRTLVSAAQAAVRRRRIVAAAHLAAVAHDLEKEVALAIERVLHELVKARALAERRRVARVLREVDGERNELRLAAQVPNGHEALVHEAYCPRVAEERLVLVVRGDVVENTHADGREPARHGGGGGGRRRPSVHGHERSFACG